MRARLTKRSLLWAGSCVVILAAATACGPAAAQSSSSASRSGSASGATPRPAAPASAAARPASLPVVNIGTYTGRKPSEIDFSADGGNVVTGIRWQSWTARGATGHGTSAIESCVPNCAQGPVTYVPTTITLSAPLGGKFTVLTETRKGRAMTLRYPAYWALAAS
ncbi:MAG TPA: hypothetical protein VK817_07035 [Trebonia sp.]|nr:hypothetical protein [Trebonia sp.]